MYSFHNLLIGAKFDARQHCLARQTTIENLKFCYTNIDVKVKPESVDEKNYNKKKLAVFSVFYIF